MLKILQEFPVTRNTDEALVRVYTSIYCKGCIDLEKMGFSVKMIKNILRARRKVQEVNPELKAVEEIQVKRDELEQQFRLTRGNFVI